MKYKFKDTEFKVTRWKLGESIEGVTRYCQTFCLNTSSGVLRVAEGDYIVKGPAGFKMVFRPHVFDALFDEVPDDGN